MKKKLLTIISGLILLTATACSSSSSNNQAPITRVLNVNSNEGIELSIDGTNYSNKLESRNAMGYFPTFMESTTNLMNNDFKSLKDKSNKLGENTYSDSIFVYSFMIKNTTNENKTINLSLSLDSYDYFDEVVRIVTINNDKLNNYEKIDDLARNEIKEADYQKDNPSAITFNSLESIYKEEININSNEESRYTFIFWLDEKDIDVLYYSNYLYTARGSFSLNIS